MGWFTRALSPPSPLSVPAPTMCATPDKIALHIARFTRALEQCEKGPKRRAELQANLDYWLAIQAAEKALNP